MKEIKVLHRQAMERTDLALAARQKGETGQALLHFREAYDLESKAAAFLANDFNAEPTRSVLLRSAAALALDCNLLPEAEKLICTALIGQPPLEIAEELRDLLEQVYFQRHLDLRGISLSNEELQMSIAGKEISYGISPAEAFLERVGNTEKLLYRTAERKQQKPYRDRGRPDKALQESLKLYVTAPRAASFAVTFRVGGTQLSLPGLSLGEQIIDELLDCLDLFTRGEEALLKDRIPEDAYYRNFVGLARGIAPDGQQVNLVGFTTSRLGREKKVALTTASAMLVPLSISAQVSTKGLPDGGTVEVSGRLKFADSLQEGKDKIQIIDAGNVKHTVIVPQGMMSDIVKPLWDTQVVVTGTQIGKSIHLEWIHPVTPEQVEGD